MEGNDVYVLSCGIDDTVFRVPITVPDTDTHTLIYNKIVKYKGGFNAVLHFDVAKAGELHKIIRTEIEEYKCSNVENQKEVLVLEETGFRSIKDFGTVIRHKYMTIVKAQSKMRAYMKKNLKLTPAAKFSTLLGMYLYVTSPMSRLGNCGWIHGCIQGSAV